MQRAKNIDEAVTLGQCRVEGGLEGRELPGMGWHVPGLKNVEVTRVMELLSRMTGRFMEAITGWTSFGCGWKTGASARMR
jgi:hypothetical protein